jgi:hypothetical protein
MTGPCFALAHPITPGLAGGPAAAALFLLDNRRANGVNLSIG